MDNAMQLKRRIGAYSFAIWELTLYLDTHPQCACALGKYHEFKQARRQLIDEYETQFGPFVLTSNDVKGECWTWVDGPWPWECRGGN